MIRSLNQVRSESTCQKRIVVCMLFDKNDIMLVRESNRCNPDGGICHRLDIRQDKSNYDLNSTCNWTHAEVMALEALPEGSKPYRAKLIGHDFYCDNCEAALRAAGIQILEIE